MARSIWSENAAPEKAQVHLNERMRSILIASDVHMKCKLRPETLFSAVHLIDRYLEVQVPSRSQLQLVGVTAMLMAAKLEEVNPPQVGDFVHIMDSAYAKEEILKMEMCILKVLQFKTCDPTAMDFAMDFVERCQSMNGCTDAHRDLGQYLLELTLVPLLLYLRDPGIINLQLQQARRNAREQQRKARHPCQSSATGVGVKCQWLE